MHTLHCTWTHVCWRCRFSWVVDANPLVFANSGQLCPVMTPGHCKQLNIAAKRCTTHASAHTNTHTHTHHTHVHTHTLLTGSGSGSREILTAFFSRSQISTVPSQPAVVSSEEARGWNRRMLHLSSWPARQEARGRRLHHSNQHM